MPFEKYTYAHAKWSGLNKLEFYIVRVGAREVMIWYRTSSGNREHPVCFTDVRVSVTSPNNRQRCTPWSVYSVHVQRLRARPRPFTRPRQVDEIAGAVNWFLKNRSRSLRIPRRDTLSDLEALQGMGGGERFYFW